MSADVDTDDRADLDWAALQLKRAILPLLDRVGGSIAQALRTAENLKRFDVTGL